jgi:signal transduction histidine kinase
LGASGPSVVPESGPRPAGESDLTAAQDRITELEQENANLRKLLTESQRLATIGTVAAVIAHEFNNLLTPVVSYSQYALQTLKDGKSDAALIEKALAKSVAGGERAGKICASMLGLARGQSSFGAVAVYGLVETVMTLLARDPAKDNITLRVSVPPGLTVVGDSVQLEQVMLNLIINARQAMVGKTGVGRGGMLVIRAEGDETLSQATIHVSDTGSGIAPEHLGRIFEPFFSTKSSSGIAGPTGAAGGGSGLGLAICKEIVEHHHGRIEVTSEVGKGTTFSVTLPMAAGM